MRHVAWEEAERARPVARGGVVRARRQPTGRVVTSGHWAHRIRVMTQRQIDVPPRDEAGTA
jgi:hypothetical protein